VGSIGTPRAAPVVGRSRSDCPVQRASASMIGSAERRVPIGRSGAIPAPRLAGSGTMGRGLVRTRVAVEESPQQYRKEHADCRVRNAETKGCQPSVCAYPQCNHACPRDSHDRDCPPAKKVSEDRPCHNRYGYHTLRVPAPACRRKRDDVRRTTSADRRSYVCQGVCCRFFGQASDGPLV
jgi:hypothetical protein